MEKKSCFAVCKEKMEVDCAGGELFINDFRKQSGVRVEFAGPGAIENGDRG